MRSGRDASHGWGVSRRGAEGEGSTDIPRTAPHTALTPRPHTAPAPTHRIGARTTSLKSSCTAAIAITLTVAIAVAIAIAIVIYTSIYGHHHHRWAVAIDHHRQSAWPSNTRPRQARRSVERRGGMRRGMAIDSSWLRDVEVEAAVGRWRGGWRVEGEASGGGRFLGEGGGVGAAVRWEFARVGCKWQ